MQAYAIYSLVLEVFNCHFEHQLLYYPQHRLPVSLCDGFLSVSLCFWQSRLFPTIWLTSLWITMSGRFLLIWQSWPSIWSFFLEECIYTTVCAFQSTPFTRRYSRDVIYLMRELSIGIFHPWWSSFHNFARCPWWMVLIT